MTTLNVSAISENGYVAVRALHWRNPSSSFLFDSQNMKVKAFGFPGLIDVSSKLQFKHALFHRKTSKRL
jgi:hypothetical protein